MRRARRGRQQQVEQPLLGGLLGQQRVILGAFTEVINRLAMVENYTRSIEVRRRQFLLLLQRVRIRWI